MGHGGQEEEYRPDCRAMSRFAFAILTRPFCTRVGHVVSGWGVVWHLLCFDSCVDEQLLDGVALACAVLKHLLVVLSPETGISTAEHSTTCLRGYVHLFVFYAEVRSVWHTAEGSLAPSIQITQEIRHAIASGRATSV
jgi:hypothetical protein